MKLTTAVIDLGDGDTATVYVDVLRITARLHEAELHRHMSPVGKEKVLLSQLESADVPPNSDYTIDLAGINDDDINEIFILHQVKEWTLGPIDKHTLDYLMTKDQYRKLVREMDRLYRPLPLP